VLSEPPFPPHVPLVFLLTDNTGKLFGSYLTGWGRAPLQVLVLDEVSSRPMSFVNLGALRGQVVPVSFYGMSR
jgi:ethanolamine utilization protein EutA